MKLSAFYVIAEGTNGENALYFINRFFKRSNKPGVQFVVYFYLFVICDRNRLEIQSHTYPFCLCSLQLVCAFHFHCMTFSAKCYQSFHVFVRDNENVKDLIKSGKTHQRTMIFRSGPSNLTPML